MIILDACVLIAFLEEADASHDAAVRLVLEHAGEDFGASTITIAEVLVGPAKAGADKLSAAQRALGQLIRYEVEVSAGAAPDVARLRADTGLKMPDCLVLRAAGQSDGRLATFDVRLIRAAENAGYTVFS